MFLIDWHESFYDCELVYPIRVTKPVIKSQLTHAQSVVDLGMGGVWIFGGGTRRFTVQDFVEKTPGAELAVIPGGSHGFLSDRPLISEAVLRSWFRRNEPSQ